MKKRILSCLMTLALCLTLLPTAALAEETEGTAQTPPVVEESTDPANGEAKQEKQPAEAKQENQSAATEQEGQSAEQEEQQEDSAAKQAVAAVQAMIDALPDAETLDGMDDEDAMEVYEAFQAVCDAYYDTLTEGQQAQLKNTEKLEALSKWFSQSAALAEGTEHTDHSICGETGCTEHGGNVSDWKGVSSLNEINGAGYYYLTRAVQIDSTWEPESGVVLCLNGYSITANGKFNAITIQDGRTFTLCDCKGSGSTGMVTHSSGTGSGVYVNGTFNMYGGSISGNSAIYGGGVRIERTIKGPVFNMYGGEITNNKAASSGGFGGGVYVCDGTFKMSGGSITKNTVSDTKGIYYGGGMYVSESATFTVSGTVNITGNTAENGNANNVFLPFGDQSLKSFTIGEAGLAPGSSIGVATNVAPNPGYHLTVATLSEGAAYIEGTIISDRTGGYAIKAKGNNINLYNGLPHEHYRCNGKDAETGGDKCTGIGGHTEEGVLSFKAWTSMTQLPTMSGEYYLTKDVTLDSAWSIKGTGGEQVRFVLCLNGHSIRLKDGVNDYVINVGAGGTLALCDCDGSKGTITGSTKSSGVYIDKAGAFFMYGGSISGNGNGVKNKELFQMYGGTFTMDNSAKIEGNTASNGNDNGNGGGVYVYNGTFTVSGSANVTGNKKGSTVNNVYLPDGKIIAINTMAETARIGITTEKTPTAGTQVPFATGANGDLDYATIFSCDNGSKYVVSKDTDGKLHFALHQHSWTYALKTGTTDTITVSCACGKTRDYTIMAPSSDKLTYDGNAKAAKVEFEATTETVDFPATPTVTYQKKNGETWDELSGGGRPVNAGTYRASITLGGKEASVEYSIEKATPRVLSWMGYPRGWTFRENTPIADPTELSIANGTFKDVTRFEWYNASKNADDTYTEGAKLDGNPTDAGDYIIKAVFEESNNVYAAVYALGLTIGKAQHANNGVSIEVPLTVYPASGEYTYDVDIVKALKNIPHGGGLEPNTAYGGISTYLDLVRSTRWDNGKLYVTMRSLANITGTTLGSITVNLTSKNYTVVPVVVNITLQPKREVPDISVSMDNWTYGEKAKTPQYPVMAGTEAMATYAAQGSSDFSTTVPTDAGNYTVKVQYETAIEIHTGKANFTIAPKTLTKDDLTYSGPITKVYDGGTVTYTVTDGTGKATIVDGSKLHPTKAGTVSVTATKSGGDNYEDVTSAAKEITIGQATYGSKAIPVSAKIGSTKTVDLTEWIVPNSSLNWLAKHDDFYVVENASLNDSTFSVTVRNSESVVGKIALVSYKVSSDNYADYIINIKITATAKDKQTNFKFENGSVTKTYGDGDFTLAATGEVKGSTVTYESSAPAVATVDGTGKVTIKGAGTAVITARASATEDYDEAAVTCTLTVEKKPIAIPTADATVFTYNGTEQTYALAEDGAYTITGNKQTNANETGYSVTAALKDTANTQWADGTTADKTYTFVIGKAVITVKAKDQTAYVGDKAPALGADSCTVSGLVGEEKLTTQPTVKYVGADGKEITPDMTKTGEVKISASGAAASGNYTIRYEDGKLTVSTRPSGGGGSSRPSTHPVKAEVSKDPDGTVSLSKTNAAKGDKVTITVKSDRHYEVDEVIVRDSKGKQLAVKDNGDGTFTFEMPADKVTVEPTFSWVNPFADVANSAYYVDAVEWMLKREVTQGTTDTTFSPNLNCTRAQIVTFLWRAAGSSEPKGTVSFADVSAGSYYAKAVAWAVENGITGGTGDGLFSPDAACTRAQSAAFLYRAAGSPAVGGSAGFSDVAADAYYAQAVAWAKEHGITDGIGGGLFGSANDCTRAQIAAFLWRLYAEK